MGGSRFIPASAGNTSRYSRPPSYRSVHPRVCGEHHLHPCRVCALVGSSPRLRGTLCHRPLVDSTSRFIPASAGNTSRSFGLAVAVSVHPRVCGEHSHSLSPKSRANGSSPRLRGTLQSSTPSSTCPRFIPASAGNTKGRWTETMLRPVHPRVCGEHPSAGLMHLFDNGSSPRLRGTRG